MTTQHILYVGDPIHFYLEVDTIKIILYNTDQMTGHLKQFCLPGEIGNYFSVHFYLEELQPVKLHVGKR